MQPGSTLAARWRRASPDTRIWVPLGVAAALVGLIVVVALAERSRGPRATIAPTNAAPAATQENPAAAMCTQDVVSELVAVFQANSGSSYPIDLARTYGENSPEFLMFTRLFGSFAQSAYAHGIPTAVSAITTQVQGLCKQYHGGNAAAPPALPSPFGSAQAIACTEIVVAEFATGLETGSIGNPTEIIAQYGLQSPEFVIYRDLLYVPGLVDSARLNGNAQAVARAAGLVGQACRKAYP